MSDKQLAEIIINSIKRSEKRYENYDKWSELKSQMEALAEVLIARNKD